MQSSDENDSDSSESFNLFKIELVRFLTAYDEQLKQDYEVGSENEVILEIMKVCGTNTNAIYEDKFRLLLIKAWNEKLGNEVFAIILKMRNLVSTVETPQSVSTLGYEVFQILTANVSYQEVKQVVNFFLQLVAVSIRTITTQDEIDDDDIEAAKNVMKHYPFLRGLNQFLY